MRRTRSLAPVWCNERIQCSEPLGEGGQVYLSGPGLLFFVESRKVFQ